MLLAPCLKSHGSKLAPRGEAPHPSPRQSKLALATLSQHTCILPQLKKRIWHHFECPRSSSLTRASSCPGYSRVGASHRQGLGPTESHFQRFITAIITKTLHNSRYPSILAQQPQARLSLVRASRLQPTLSAPFRYGHRIAVSEEASFINYQRKRGATKAACMSCCGVEANAV